MDKEDKIKLDKALGKATREDYLLNNPHGYSRVNAIHESKKKYKRCCKRPRIIRKVYTTE